MGKGFFYLWTAILLCAAAAAAQTPTPIPNDNSRRELEEKHQQGEYLKQTGIPSNNSANNDPMTRNYYDFRLRLPPVLAQKASIKKEEKELFKRLLKGGNNITRIFLAPPCVQNLVIDLKDPRCGEADDLDYLLYLSHYSFRIKYYGRERWSDLRLDDDHFVAGNNWHTQGILVDLGETDLTAVDKNSQQVKILRDFPIVKTTDAQVKQKKDLANGVRFEGLKLTAKQKAVLNHTYLLRSVAYKVGADRVVYQYNTDAVYVFKIVKIDADESLLIVWRKITSKEAPRIK